MSKLTHRRLCELLDYNPRTGLFRWRVRRGRTAVVGSVAGTVSAADGYRRIMIDYSRYLAQRLAWFYVHKKWPAPEADHKNRKRDDNRLTNLREATRSQNSRNSRLRRDNTSGVKGVTLDKRVMRWQALITINGKPQHIGNFSTAAKAHAAYRREVLAIDPTFARFK